MRDSSISRATRLSATKRATSRRGPNESSPAARARRQLRLRSKGSPPSGIYVSEPTARGHGGALRGGAWASVGGCALHDGVQGPHSGADEHARLTTMRETCGCSTAWPTGRTRPRRIGFGSERCTGAMGGRGSRSGSMETMGDSAVQTRARFFALGCCVDLAS
jgi:hypothetical protein